MRYEVRKSIVQIVGRIWQPEIGLFAQDKILSSHDVENCRDDSGAITRESVQSWLDCHAGDFSQIADFRASIEHRDSTIEIPWTTEGGEMAFRNAIYSYGTERS